MRGLALVLLAAGLLGAAWMLARSPRGTIEHDLGAIPREGAPSTGQTTEPAYAAPDLQPDPSRASLDDPSKQERSPSDTREVRAMDGTDRTTIQRFWAEVSDVDDMTRPRRRTASDPERGVAELPWETTGATIHAPGFVPKSVSFDRAPRVIVELDRVAGIVGRVFDGQSAPIPAAKITLEYLGALSDAVGIDAAALPMPASYQGPTLRRSSDQGHFRFDRLPDGVYRTTVQADGARQASAPLRVSSGRWKTSDHWLDEQHRLVVTVLTPEGLPAETARVSLFCDASASRGAVELHRYTDDSGEATLGPLPLGEYTVRILADEGALAPTTVKLLDTSPTLLPMSYTLTAPAPDSEDESGAQR